MEAVSHESPIGSHIQIKHCVYILCMHIMHNVHFVLHTHAQTNILCMYCAGIGKISHRLTHIVYL